MPRTYIYALHFCNEQPSSFLQNDQRRIYSCIFEQVLHWYLLSFLLFSFVQTTHLFCGSSFLSVGGTSSRKCQPALGKDWKFYSIATSSSIWQVNNNSNCRKCFFPMTLLKRIKELRSASTMKWKATFVIHFMLFLADE